MLPVQDASPAKAISSQNSAGDREAEGARTQMSGRSSSEFTIPDIIVVICFDATKDTYVGYFPLLPHNPVYNCFQLIHIREVNRHIASPGAPVADGDFEAECASQLIFNRLQMNVFHSFDTLH